MKKNLTFWIMAAMVSGGIIASCHSGGGNGTVVDDTPGKGTIRISVDESFKPIIDSQIKVYMASNPEANIIAEYKPEAECLRDLQNDSTRMVIVTRGLSKEESEGFEGKLGFKPSWGLLAYDAVAVLLHQQSKDSVFSMSELRAMLLDQSPKPYQIVMDGNKATSTVRFAIDTVLQGKPLGRQVVAAKSSPDVIDYVARTPGSLGMVGVSWIGNPDDSLQLSFMKKVQVAALECETCPGKPFTRPYQANIAMGRYPLIRGLYFILKENYNGLGRGFVNFLIYERGQLIFKRAYLLPGRMSFEVRNMRITE